METSRVVSILLGRENEHCMACEKRAEFTVVVTGPFPALGRRRFGACPAHVGDLAGNAAKR